MIHFFQDCVYDGGISGGNRQSIEFEAKFLQDIISIDNGIMGPLRAEGVWYAAEYTNFIVEVFCDLPYPPYYIFCDGINGITYDDFVEDWVVNRSPYSGEFIPDTPYLMEYIGILNGYQ